LLGFVYGYGRGQKYHWINHHKQKRRPHTDHRAKSGSQKRVATGGQKMGTHSTLNICADGGDTSGEVESIAVQRGRVLNQLRKRALALRAEVDSILADIDCRRKQQVQEPVVETVESIERALKEFQAAVHPDRHTNTEVVSRPVVPSRYTGFGPATREIDDFIQKEIFPAGRPRPEDWDRLELEIKRRRERGNRRTPR